ncbi:aldehyde dehydrogenase family protein [Caulobacter segnis]
MREAVQGGARIVVGGDRHALGGLFHQPTVLSDATPDMRLFNEEIFGPVAPVVKFHTEDEAIHLANATPFGLKRRTSTARTWPAAGAWPRRSRGRHGRHQRGSDLHRSGAGLAGSRSPAWVARGLPRAWTSTSRRSTCVSAGWHDRQFTRSSPTCWPTSAPASSRNIRARSLWPARAAHWRGGVPMHWMGDWACPSPIFAAQGVGAQITDVDGKLYDDFCLGDTPSMFEHGDASVAAAVADQIRRGAGSCCRPPRRQSSASCWPALRPAAGQTATTASDANRAAIRWARAVTGRPVVVVFDGCYHGIVDDAFVVLKDGEGVMKPSLLGQVHDLTATSAGRAVQRPRGAASRPGPGRRSPPCWPSR